MSEEIKFIGYNIRPQFLRTDNSVRITIDISKDQVENVQDILLQRIPECLCEIVIKPKVEE